LSRTSEQRPKKSRKVSTPVRARAIDALRTGTTKSVNAALLETLRAELLSGAVAPGIKLKIPALCERYAVSPGAVREALSRLVSEGLVDFADQRGFRSSPITESGLRDITRVRLLIEREALLDAIRHGDEEWEGNILAAQHRLERCSRVIAEPGAGQQGQTKLDVTVWPQRHKEFHHALVAACTSPWLLRMHDQLFDQTERYRLISATAEQAADMPKRDVQSEHDKIVEAVITRKEDLAVALVELHIRATMEIVLAGTRAAELTAAR
jgi:GntR family transcriptional regulator, carbon starvation induced regulator